MQPIDLATAGMLLDFSGGDRQLEDLGLLQMRGAVALQNMLVNPEVGMGYLADEVGMGKTYVTLGVVAMMRYFNPGYRVLYISPSRNVQDKWYGREHPNFIKTNVRTGNYKIRTPQGESGTPAISCSNIDELIRASTTGFYGDIFVRMSSFSMAMGDDDEGLERHLLELKKRVPVSVLGRVSRDKEAVKKAYAKALNYLLPTFDLVVIDEAHNFKHPFDSSARNLALSRILGFNNEAEASEVYRKRVKSALLLSATPFDVNPEHLYNQLNMVGKAHLMPDRGQWQNKKCLRGAMAQFMVRRLNELRIQDKRHTRNMYRREWRKGERAEIEFETDEHKLITALVQKHIGDMLDGSGGNPSFQLGLLASFESYAQTAGAGPVEFDGEKSLETQSDAQDRHLIASIRDSYVIEESFGKSLPHPKMDQVSREAASLALNKGRKQLIFVRRVKSVAEIKHKLDDEYDSWLRQHIDNVLAGFTDPLHFFKQAWDDYQKTRKFRDNDISGGEANVVSGNDEENPPPKKDTFFNWFFRGAKPEELTQIGDRYRLAMPDALRNSLTSRNNASILLFEVNWAAWVAKALFGMPLNSLIDRLGKERVDDVLESAPAMPEDDILSQFLSIQQTFLQEVVRQTPGMPGIAQLADYLQPLIDQNKHCQPIEVQAGIQLLSLDTFFSHLYESDLSQHCFNTDAPLAKALKQGDRNVRELIHRVEIHRQLMAQSFRSGHPFIDLYLVRLSLGQADLNETRRQEWLTRLCRTLVEQQSYAGFSTMREITLLNENLDLVIKNNLPGVYARTRDELRLWLYRQLSSSAPIIGASGETTANRSSQARKFRMPGYPLILVSTDVFQEGEDLHTFCDSVIHYGLASSPTSIEQKTGRVDRVGAYAHRRLLSLEKGQEVADDDYIQVQFPFVKQSIEALQVRALCKNLNVFLGSLHEIGVEGKSMDEFVDISRELYSRNEIPDQLMDLLTSPYTPLTLTRSNLKLEKQVQHDTALSSAAVRHVAAMVKSVAGVCLDSSDSVQVKIPGLEHHRFNVSLDSARSSGEMLLRVIAKDAIDVVSSKLERSYILNKQAVLYRDALYRTYAVEVSGGYKLLQDAEMLVGGPGITDDADIAGLFGRFSKPKKHIDEQAPFAKIIDEFDEERCNTYLASAFHWKGTLLIKRRASSLSLIFKFDGKARRQHHIRVAYRHGCCYFEAMIANEDVVKDFSSDKLLNCTWLKNGNVDLVEFLVRPKDGCLVARALQPALSMGFEEFIFTAYVLAVDADRMEYLIKEDDEY